MERKLAMSDVTDTQGIEEQNEGQTNAQVTEAPATSLEGTGNTEPVDLAEAFKLLKADDAKAPAPAVEPGSSGAEGDPADPVHVQPVEAAPSQDSQPAGAGGGSPAATEQHDYTADQKALVESITREAARRTNKFFADKNIRPQTIRDIYEQDNQTGVISFRNPDNPNQPFQSRAEAQAWLDSANSQLKIDWEDLATQSRQELLKQYEPTMKLYAFVPKYNALDEVRQEMLDTIVEPYAIKDAGGNTIGYSCDLDAALTQTEKIIQGLLSRQQQASISSEGSPAVPEAKKPATTPALDMKSSNGSASSVGAEPKDINEAMKMYQKQKREGKK
jgi:hypothetical protein